MADMDVMTPAEANPQNVQDLTVFVSTCLFVGVMVVERRESVSVRLLHHIGWLHHLFLHRMNEWANMYVAFQYNKC